MVTVSGEYGPNSDSVKRLLIQIKSLTPPPVDEPIELGKAFEYSCLIAKMSKRKGMVTRARDDARKAALQLTQRIMAPHVYAASDAAAALVLQDLLPRPTFDDLCRAWEMETTLVSWEDLDFDEIELRELVASRARVIRIVDRARETLTSGEAQLAYLNQRIMDVTIAHKTDKEDDA